MNKRVRNIILGSLCCLLAMPFMYTIYWSSLNLNWIGNIILGGYKHVFFPALIYLYISLIIDKNKKRTVLLNLIPPFFVHILYITIKFEFREFYLGNIIDLVAGINFFIFFSYMFYISKGFLILKKLKLTLLPNIHRRYVVFYTIMTLYGTLLVSMVLLPYILYSEKLKATSSFLSMNFYTNMAIVINSGMLIFAFIESPSLKRFLLGDKIYTGFDTIKNDDKIKTYINKIFDEQKLFLDVDFDLKISLIESNIDEKEFKLFLKKEFNKSPIEFVNNYRVREFKRLLTLSENRKYSLIGIANKVGFNSKATFYRNFKKIEGITPKEYWNQIEKAT